MANAADPIAQQFSQIRTMLGSGNTPGGPSGSVATEPVGGENSLTNFIRSLTNLGGSTAGSMLGAGSNLLGSGLNVAGEGLDLFKDPASFYSKILSGDKQAMTEAIAPTAGAISQQYDAATRSAETGMARGGYRSATLANLPFQKAQQIGNLYAPLQAEAAKGLAGIAGEVGGLGTTLAGLGQSEQGLGLESLIQTLQAQLTRRGQDMGVGSFANQFQQISAALANLI